MSIAARGLRKPRPLPYLRSMIRTAAILSVIAAASVGLTACQKPGDDAFGQKVRSYLLAHPEVIREVAQKLAENDRAAALKSSGDIIAKYRSQIERDPRDFVANPAGKITVTEFFDYRCSYCKLTAPEIVKLVADNPDIRFVFKELPIFGSVSDNAAKIALTATGKTKGMALYAAWMGEKALDDAAVDRHVTSLGLNATQLRQSALADPAIERQILDTRALATALKIEGTPAFIIGNTLIPGADLSALRAAIAAARGNGQSLRTLG